MLRNRAWTLGPNLVPNGDFGEAVGAHPKGWTVLSKDLPEQSWGIQPTNSPFTMLLAANNRSARFVAEIVPKQSQNVFRMNLKKAILGDDLHGESVLFSWDVLPQAGRDVWDFVDQTGNNTRGFICRLTGNVLSLDLSTNSQANVELVPNAWYHIEMLVDYANESAGVSGGVYDTVGRQMKAWANYPIYFWMKTHTNTGSGCDSFWMKNTTWGSHTTLLLDNVYIGFATPRKP